MKSSTRVCIPQISNEALTNLYEHIIGCIVLIQPSTKGPRPVRFD
jgi:hypothetical protein